MMFKCIECGSERVVKAVGNFQIKRIDNVNRLKESSVSIPELEGEMEVFICLECDSMISDIEVEETGTLN